MPVLFCRRPVLRAFALFALLCPALLRAEGYDGFTVSNITEEVRDENLAQGRNRALLLAQRDAYQTLMQRLTATSDWSRLPKLDDASLEDLVQDDV